MVFKYISREIAKVWQIALFPPSGNTANRQISEEIGQLPGPGRYIQEKCRNTCP